MIKNKNHRSECQRYRTVFLKLQVMCLCLFDKRKDIVIHYNFIHYNDHAKILCTMTQQLTATTLAKSPSVKIKVHLSDSFPLALLASSTFSIPWIFSVFVTSLFLRSLFSLKFAHDRRLSTIPDFETAKRSG